MGGFGSGGRSKPEDREVADHWDKLPPTDGTDLRTVQVRCRHCGKVRSKNTTRQREHQLSCQPYLDAMAGVGGTNSIVAQLQNEAENNQQAPPPSDAERNPISSGKKGGGGKPHHTVAIRIQALALAEAGFEAQKVWQITGVAPWTLSYIKKTARARGYDPSVSMQLKEEYVAEGKRSGRPKRNGQGQAAIQGQHAGPAQYMPVAHQMALSQFLAPPPPQHIIPGKMGSAPPPIIPQHGSAQNTGDVEQDARRGPTPAGDDPRASIQSGAHSNHEVSSDTESAGGDSIEEDGRDEDASGDETNTAPSTSRDTTREATNGEVPNQQVSREAIAASDNPFYQLEAILNVDNPPVQSNLRPSNPTPVTLPPMMPTPREPTPLTPTPEVPRQKRKYNKRPRTVGPLQHFQPGSQTIQFGQGGLTLPPGNWNFSMGAPST